jgi:hypothetical protein
MGSVFWELDINIGVGGREAEKNTLSNFLASRHPASQLSNILKKFNLKNYQKIC